MKYPIDPQTAETFFGHLIAHDRAQRQMIQALTLLITEAMAEPTPEQPDWYDEARKLLNLQKLLKREHETRIFNSKNGHQDPTVIKIENTIETGNVEPISNTVYVPGIVIDPAMNARLNKQEESFGEEMSEEEIARMFNEKHTKKLIDGIDMTKKNPFKGMTLQEITNWEEKQNNSNDLYKIKARIQNLVATAGGSLTSAGEMVVNSFVHVVKDLYEFANTVSDKELKIELIERIRKHENMPATLMSALNGGVRMNK